MRISNNMMIYNFLGSLNKSMNRMNTIQEQLSDGKLIHRPSDDPVRAFRSLRFNVSMTTNEQYTQNAKDATEWLNQSDSALADLSEIAQSAKETAVEAISANPPVANEAFAAKIDGLINQAVTVANTQLGDRYILAGQRDKMTEPPYERTTLNINGVAADVVIYKGDLNKISLPIQAGAADPSRDSINVTGEDVFGPLTTVTDDSGVTYKVAGVFNDLIQLKQQITGSSTSQSNTAGGSGTISGTYTGTGTQAFKVKIQSVDGIGQVTAARYSTDNGLTWTDSTAAVPATVPPTWVLPGGIGFSIATTTTNAANDTYNFQVANGKAGVSNLQWISDTALANVDKDHDRILLAQTQIGARMASYEMAQNMMERDNTTIAENQSANDDIDIAKTTIDFKNIQNVYQAALAVGAQIMPASLVNFLK